MENIDEQKLRDIARILDINNYWNKKKDNLILDIRRELSLQDDLSIEMCQANDIFDHDQLYHLEEVFEAYQYFTAPRSKAFLHFVDDHLIPAADTRLSLSKDVLHNMYRRASSSITVPHLDELLIQLCVVYKNLGWYYKDDRLHIGYKPVLRLSKHIDLYKDMKNKLSNEKLYQVLDLHG